MAKNSQPTTPPYLKNIYGWLYKKEKYYNLLDNAYVLNILTLGAHYVLTKELTKEIYPHSQILQIGATLGSQIEKTYSVLDTAQNGSYTIVDILPDIIEKKQKKHFQHKISWITADASKTIKGTYDTIICYMLLHELPPRTRAKILNNLINALTPNGKIIFIDYHQPSSYNPLKYLIRAINRLYQPFAESLWKNSIKTLTPEAEKCTWSKQTYYGGLYQKVVAAKNK